MKATTGAKARAQATAMARAAARGRDLAGRRATAARARDDSGASGRHAHASAAGRPVACAIITVSDTRGRADDGSGDAMTRLLEAAGHPVSHRVWVGDEAAAIRRAVRSALGKPAIDVILLTGGTGVAPRDVTPEAIAPLLETPLPGFGERFRALSQRQVGSAAWLSRACAGIARGRLVVALPGSTRAVELALAELVIPELGHMVRLLGRLKEDA
ncbi:MAG: molybdenum cofactor biosynthesis protein B [Candidatus Eisenbacteria bacterium]